MGTVVEKIHDLEYDELTTLGVVEQDADLTAVFRTEIGMPFSVLYTIQKKGQFNDETKEILRLIFEKIILTKQDLINKYIKLGGFEPIPSKEVDEQLLEGFDDAVEEVEEVLQEEKVVEYKNPSSEMVKDAEKPVMVKFKVTKSTPKQPSKAKTTPKVEEDIKIEIPRRYGKKNILADIEAQGGKPTLCQTALLQLNDLKNIVVILNNKGIKDIHTKDKDLLTSEEYREIIGTIKLLKRRLDPIIKKRV